MPGTLTHEALSMNKAQQKKFDSLYKKHVNALKRQGKSAATIDTYSRAIRRILWLGFFSILHELDF